MFFSPGSRPSGIVIVSDPADWLEISTVKPSILTDVMPPSLFPEIITSSPAVASVLDTPVGKGPEYGLGTGIEAPVKRAAPVKVAEPSK
jgi:hypothetical protein